MSDLEPVSCHRCGVISPDGEVPPVEWEVYSSAFGEVLICESCLTPAEQQAIDEDDLAMVELLARCARCGRRRDEAHDEEDWVPGLNGAIACPTCLSPDEVLDDIEELNDAGWSGSDRS